MTKPVTGQTTFGSNTSGTTTQLDNNFLLAYNALNDFNTYPNYLVDTGSANSIVVTLGANLTGALTDGLVIQVKVAAANTGATNLNYNSGGNVGVTTAAGVALSGGELAANGIYQFEYSSGAGKWILQTPSVGFGTWTPTLTFATPGDLNVAYTTRVGIYSKHGRRVTLTCSITTSTFTFSTASGNCEITGMPFTAITSAGTIWQGSMTWQGITKANYTQWNPVIQSAGTFVIFSGMGSGQSATSLQTGDMPSAGTVIINFTISYETAA